MLPFSFTYSTQRITQKGMFWVPGAACGIYGIRHAGLAMAVGTWASIVVISSFIWGIVIFQEKVKNLLHTSVAFLLLMTGLIGMSRYAKPESTVLSKARILDDLSEESDSDSMEEGKTGINKKRKVVGPMTSNISDQKSFEIEPLTPNRSADIQDEMIKDGSEKDHIVFFGGRIALTRRQLGVLGAAVNGGWGGLNLIPMHIASKQGFKGASYLISYATGSMIVNVVMWVVYFLYTLYQKRGSMPDAMAAFPKFHFKVLWLPGLLSGCLYSIANFAAILSVTYLGQGVGMSMCQGQLLVSGLWGIFYYGEIKGRTVIIKWFLSALVAVAGILLLSHEHESSVHRRLMMTMRMMEVI